MSNWRPKITNKHFEQLQARLNTSVLNQARQDIATGFCQGLGLSFNGNSLIMSGICHSGGHEHVWYSGRLEFDKAGVLKKNFCASTRR